MTLVLRSFNLQVREPDAAPAWVGNLAVGSGWQYLAGGPAGGTANWPASAKPLADWQRGNRIVDIRAPQPQTVAVGTWQSGFGALEDVVQPWCGAAMNPDRKELYFPANGGGGAYAGNEVYGLELWRDTPAWRLMSERTPDAYMDASAVQGTWSTTDIPATHRDGSTGQLGDGRPRAFHSSSNIQYANGRIWNVLQTAVTPNLSTQGLWSWDREWVETQPNARAVWVNGDILPWRLHGIAGITGSGPSYAFCATAFDPVSNRVWAYADKRAWAVDAVTGGIAVPAFTHGAASLISNGQTRGGWACYVPGTPRRIFVGLCRKVGQEILVHNLENNTFAVIAATPALQWDPDSYWCNWTDPAVALPDGINRTPGDLYLPTANPYLENEFAYGMGAVYSDGLIYIGIVPARASGTLGGQVRMLDVAAFLAGEECLTELTNTGARPIALEEGPGYVQRTQWGNWQRFNLVQFGSAKVLIHAADAHGPTHVWRIA